MLEGDGALERLIGKVFPPMEISVEKVGNRDNPHIMRQPAFLMQVPFVLGALVCTCAFITELQCIHLWLIRLELPVAAVPGRK